MQTKHLVAIAVFVLACSGSSTNAVSLTGQQGFVVGSSMLDARETVGACGANTVGNGYAALSIQLFESTTATCASAAKSGRLLDIGIATHEYASGKTGSSLTQPLTTGTFTIGNEQIPDEDLCSLSKDATAILQIRNVTENGSTNTVWNAMSGTVTIDELTNGSVSGSFDVVLTDPNDNGTNGGALHGTFGTSSACP
jgi:hypothetical protein